MRIFSLIFRRHYDYLVDIQPFYKKKKKKKSDELSYSSQRTFSSVSFNIDNRIDNTVLAIRIFFFFKKKKKLKIEN
jgi:hypothetical protein